MNRILRSLLVVILFSSFASYAENNNCCGTTGNACNACCYDCNSCCLGPCDGYPFLQLRSQGRDAARQLVGTQQFINKYDMDSVYGLFSVGVEYKRSFRGERLTHALFGNDLVNCCQLYVQGSQIADRHQNAWLADYFGLSPQYDGRVNFNPQIQNVIVDFDFFLGLDELAEGLFVRVNAPLAWTKWELCACETIKDKGIAGFDAGYMSEGAYARTSMADTFLSTMNGNYKFGDLEKPLQYGRITNCDCTKTRIAEIDLTLGWNFVLEEDYHFGAFLYVAAPAGNRPCAKILFEPVVGNGKHWEFGGGFTSSWIFYRSEACEDRFAGIWFEATLSHLFKNCQCRSFDFCCKPGSRYMLLEKMGSNDDDAIIKGETDTNTFTAAKYKYKRNLVHAIDWSTMNVDVRIDLQADVAIKLGWVRDNWDFDLGYNFWARTGEKFCNECCPCDSSDVYAIKGDTFIYGAIEGTNDLANGTKYPLSATQNTADIHAGKNYPSVSGDNPKTNPRIDNAYNATVTSADTELFVINSDTSVAANRIKTSIDPITVAKNQLNLGKSPSAISHKLFAHVGYTWKDREEDWVPFLGIGGNVEFAQDNWSDCCCGNRCCDTNCTTCSTTNCTTSCTTCTKTTTNGSSSCNCCDSCSRRIGVSQWGVWIKGGVAFD